jgi:hypothetical protein
MNEYEEALALADESVPMLAMALTSPELPAAVYFVALGVTGVAESRKDEGGAPDPVQGPGRPLSCAAPVVAARRRRGPAAGRLGQDRRPDVLEDRVDVVLGLDHAELLVVRDDFAQGGLGGGVGDDEVVLLR